MNVANRVVGAVLSSPLHWLLGRRLALVRYVGRVSGQSYTLPTQYVRDGDRLVIVAGRADGKRWWRNFTEPMPAEVLLDGTWHQCDLAVAGERDREAAVPAYSARFPSASKWLADPLAGAVVLVGTLSSRR